MSAGCRIRRYPSGTTDAEWALLEPLLPRPACKTAAGGRPEKHHRRVIVDALRYVTDNGIKWRALPADFPPWQTVHGFFARWSEAGVFERIRDRLREKIRLRADRNPAPSAAVIDSQPVKAAETVGRPSRGYDGGKKIDGRKRRIAVDTQGLLLVVLVTAASLQDRAAARQLLTALHTAFRGVAWVWADGGYTSKALADWAKDALRITFGVVKKIAGQTSFVILPRRWVVERTFSWITQARRNVRDYERLPGHSAAFINNAMITMMTRSLTRRKKQARTT
ncbi:IS5 family transposase [Amycolatopsis rubida]|uniref:IS5 family transposase n=1 Tax=Amycolatopsis rubida TaxID=112413 RepID=A0ABX0BQU1_9PSEU|nr:MULTISPECIES: IS5 family transposase [Amycolatopsis]MYW92735.1 IS5 family transposase [Amycolatopsis rubida]NEC57721.1 IS5 family transposase [Amycolatopsis rubida]OAP24879.1 Transposase DDE domain protein [Amycolatopsis sp. M39]